MAGCSGPPANALVERHETPFTETRCAAPIAMVVGSAPHHWYLSRHKEIHLVNNTADMHHPVAESFPVRDLTVGLARQHCSRVHSLRLETDLPHTLRDRLLTITLPVLDHCDVVVIE